MRRHKCTCVCVFVCSGGGRAFEVDRLLCVPKAVLCSVCVVCTIHTLCAHAHRDMSADGVCVCVGGGRGGLTHAHLSRAVFGKAAGGDGGHTNTPRTLTQKKHNFAYTCYMLALTRRFIRIPFSSEPSPPPPFHPSTPHFICSDGFAAVTRRRRDGNAEQRRVLYIYLRCK